MRKAGRTRIGPHAAYAGQDVDVSQINSASGQVSVESQMMHAATQYMKPTMALSAAGQSSDDPQLETAATLALNTIGAVRPPKIAELIEWQKRRVHAIRVQSKCDRSCDAYVARYLGYHAGLPEAERKALMKQAGDLRRQVECEQKPRGRKGGDHPIRGAPDSSEGRANSDTLRSAALAACLPIIINTIQSRAGWDAMRADAEKRMREIARGFAVWPRCERIVGFKDLGLASLVAEAGNDLSAYPHYYHLWKRLGLAPYKGRAVSSYGKGDLSKAEWTEAGYNRVRRGLMAGDIGVPLLMQKRRHAYGVVYAERRERTALTHPEWSDGHSDNDARRVMLKALVADIWRWWNPERASASLHPGSGMPSREEAA